MMTMAMTGGCLCGAVRYEIAGEHASAGTCYCADCQKETGGGHVTAVGVPDAAIAFTGDVRTFSKLSDTGHAIVRSFCPNCGTTLRSQPQIVPGISMVRAGTLDDSSAIHVRSAIFTASARHWDQPPEGLPGVPGMPSAG